MEDVNIVYRIVCDIESLSYLKEVTVGMTEELFCRLCPDQAKSRGPYCFLGCKVKFIGNRGMSWIVGYAGGAEDEE